ncbi:hypothetical protein LEP1GSC132_3573 [Leptospira kirschneri str. 200803703]|nr:hypothetical protein LEP1GSC132_3573 [Leptospira kirschneri str. 200803703]
MIILSDFLYGFSFEFYFPIFFLCKFMENKSFTAKSEFVRVPTFYFLRKN